MPGRSGAAACDSSGLQAVEKRASWVLLQSRLCPGFSTGFSLVQAACGHGQLHLAMNSLRLNRLSPFIIDGVALRS